MDQRIPAVHLGPLTNKENDHPRLAFVTAHEIRDVDLYALEQTVRVQASGRWTRPAKRARIFKNESQRSLSSVGGRRKERKVYSLRKQCDCEISMRRFQQTVP